jgi:hypothetical protein
MATGHYRLETKIIGRRVKGVDKSVSMVAKAAYRSGQSLHDDRADKTFNYRPRTQEVVYSEILSPQNAPGWLKEPSPDNQAGTRKQRDTREQLWNTVEQVEKRKLVMSRSKLPMLIDWRICIAGKCKIGGKCQAL